jgi:23S rRNA (pseudouridine1915-N3)-methyltransferase
MRKIRILAVGKDKEPWLTDGADHFRKLLNRYASVEIEIIAKTRTTSSSLPDGIRASEGDALLSRIGDGIFVALHDRGEALTSERFARLLDKLTAQQRGTLTFVIGGAYGLDKKVLARAQQCISLSPLTFSHQVVRLVLLEQLYRAFTIIEGTDYHK